MTTILVLILITVLIAGAHIGSEMYKEIIQQKHIIKLTEEAMLQSDREYLALNERFEKLQNQKISADVKMGQKAENLLPFLESFPYKDDEIKGMFQPIDLIVFRPDEIVFVEIKSGQSQLSDKQKLIKKLIDEKKVRFEVHRMNEKGVTVK
jgi:predicted Holliday junction resolvase-like endonuclease